MTAQLAAFATDVEELSADRATHRPGLSADFTRRGVPAVGPPDRSLQLGRQVVGSRIVPLNGVRLRPFVPRDYRSSCRVAWAAGRRRSSCMVGRGNVRSAVSGRARSIFCVVLSGWAPSGAGSVIW